ncbi:MAG: TRAP transporter substrate-binding protein DctP, partial [Candidatus Eisenbacteria bacterium]|nr:TRAP transporter substrate-binding protein DctP [Candidatus Eisenbacteria bacterium]
MTHVLRSVATMLILSVSVASGAALKFASLAPEGTSWMKEMHALAEDIALATGNRVTLKLYPGGVAGDERDVLRKIQVG